jgi:hypothetical protein
MLESSVSGADGVIRELSDMADRVDDLRPLFDGDVADLWRRRQRAVFSSGKLAPLSPASVKRKRVNKTTPLVDTGELRDVDDQVHPDQVDAADGEVRYPQGFRLVVGSGS